MQIISARMSAVISTYKILTFGELDCGSEKFDKRQIPHIKAILWTSAVNHRMYLV